ncbi:AAA family ATPase, partial [Anaerosporobacter sp.]|uniref:AAA family ATPase n=1 Tax=Anaerosporobacter sp. TaxID=1872529 RepID=UPI002F40857E
MNEKYIVRIIKSELENFKNVRYGEIKYMNYRNVERDAKIENHDIVGIYGQNGSGKTAMIEAFDILK